MAVYIHGKILADDSLKIPRGLESKVWMNNCYPLPERDATKKSLDIYVFRIYEAFNLEVFEYFS